jgi:methylated-DNA-[protein]-cysteine S-methyltransferase
MIYTGFQSPIGSITIATDGRYLREVHIENDRYFQHIPSNWIQDARQPLLLQARSELEGYLRGSTTTFSVPIAAEGTDFQKEVWQALAAIPPGSTSTYTAIAAAIQRPKAVRAVGTAIGKNPLCIIVPCHRVLASDGGLGGYVAGVAIKQKLLQLEDQSAN